MSVSTLIFINIMVIVNGFIISIFGLMCLMAHISDFRTSYKRYCLFTLCGILLFIAGLLVWAIGDTKVDTYTADKYDLQAMYSDMSPMTVKEGDEECIKISSYFGREEAIYYVVPSPTPSPYDDYLLAGN